MLNVQPKTAVLRFNDLQVWKEAHRLVIVVYQITKQFPREEIFGLVMQMRRCSVSITSNIAEGFSRRSYKEKAQFYSMALGSLTELQNQLLISKDVGFLDEKEYNGIVMNSEAIHKMLNGLIKSSRNKILNS
jgi:four helix bundle protein